MLGLPIDPYEFVARATSESACVGILVEATARTTRRLGWIERKHRPASWALREQVGSHPPTAAGARCAGTNTNELEFGWATHDQMLFERPQLPQAVSSRCTARRR